MMLLRTNNVPGRTADMFETARAASERCARFGHWCIASSSNLGPTRFARPSAPFQRHVPWGRDDSGQPGRLRLRCLAKGKGGGGSAKKGGNKKGASTIPKHGSALDEAEQGGASAADSMTPYTQGDVIMHSLELIDSHFRALGSPIFSEPVDIASAAKALWEADFAVMSHGTEDDPIYNYGNAKCLELFQTSWAEFTQMPSRLSYPEPEQQQSKQDAQAGAKDLKGCVRVSTTGRIFEIDEGALWTLVASDGENIGQAAVLRQWHFLDEEDGEGAGKGKEDNSQEPELADVPAPNTEPASTST